MEKSRMIEIHESLLNGQRRQMVDQINEHGVADFFPDYKDFLESLYIESDVKFDYFYDATKSYFRITNR